MTLQWRLEKSTSVSYLWQPSYEQFPVVLVSHDLRCVHGLGHSVNNFLSGKKNNVNFLTFFFRLTRPKVTHVLCWTRGLSEHYMETPGIIVAG